MSLKPTVSMVFQKERKMEEDNRPATDNNSEEHSTITLPGLERRKTRVPAMLQSALKDKAGQDSGRGKEQQVMKKSKIGSVVRSGLMSTIHRMKDIATCEICEGQIRLGRKKNKQVYLSDCQHKHSFCESCLHHYAIYKVKNFEQVNCPSEGCPAVMEMGTPFFGNLPADIQKNYRKIHQFQMVSKDPNSKLCPSQNCEGIIKTTVDSMMVCDSCRKEFCGKCLLAAHQGECDKQEVQFFENNLHYRQCKECGFVIEKNQGCNHMTCRCKYQFCYVCGAPWTSAHYGNHDENGNLHAVPDPGARPQRAAQERCACCRNGCDCAIGCCQIDCDDGCDCDCTCDCDCECDCDCDCLGDCCLGGVLKLLLKVLLFTLFIPVLILIFMVRDIWVILCMLFVTLLAGMFGFSCEIISDLEGPLCLLAVIFFPVTMILGVGRAFGEVFCEPVSDMMEDFCRIASEGAESICDI